MLKNGGVNQIKKKMVHLKPLQGNCKDVRGTADCKAFPCHNIIIAAEGTTHANWSNAAYESITYPKIYFGVIFDRNDNNKFLNDWIII